MTYMIICTVMIIVTVLILKDTHVKVYWTGYSSNYANIDDEYDFGGSYMGSITNYNSGFCSCSECSTVHSRVYILYNPCYVES